MSCKIDKYFKKILKLIRKKKKLKVPLIRWNFVDSTFIVEGPYNIEMYNIFLKILKE